MNSAISSQPSILSTSAPEASPVSFAPSIPSSPSQLDATQGLTKLWLCRGATTTSAPSQEPLLLRLLRARGLTEPAEVTAFLEPKLTGLHNPSLIPDLDRAATRLLAAINANERIVIYGDYDVDGITATSILYHIIKAIDPEANVQSYIPHRLDEGYGLNADAISEIADQGPCLIISVDCGITATAPAAIAKSRGIDLIITDHHNPPDSLDQLPDAYAVVHPRRPDSTYPYGELCGAAVAYKLAWRLCTLHSNSQRISDTLRGMLIELLAYCALGVIADVVPLRDENRIITRHGLSRIKNAPFPGLRALIIASGLDGEKVNTEDVGFKLAPRLNACGRMGHAREAVELLTTATGARATEIADHLTRQNDQRRAVERAIFEQASKMAVEQGMTTDDRRAIVLAHPDWHAGVVGIVCSRLVERFHRPTILLSRTDTHMHGSARSIEGFNLHAGLVACHSHLIKYGGHDMAAGMQLCAEAFPAFVDTFTAYCNQQLTPRHLIGRAPYDCDVDIRELSLQTVKSLAQLGPFGRDNPSPTLRLRNVKVISRPNTFGSGNDHIRFLVTNAVASIQGAAPPPALPILAWKWARHINSIHVGKICDLLIKPQISSFGKPHVECELVDIASCL